MITNILLNLLLVLCILWAVLGLVYSLAYWRWRVRHKATLQEPRIKPTESEEISSSEHQIVGKSKGFTSQVFPKVPDASSKEKSEPKPSTFAAQSAEAEQEKDSSEDEDNELEVAYTTEEIDETEVLREELGFEEDAREVSPTSILSRDLLRLSQWGKHDDSLGKVSEAEVKDMLHTLQGTDLLTQYQAHLKTQESAHQKLLCLIRKVEAEEEPLLSPAIASEEVHSLDYYL